MVLVDTSVWIRALANREPYASGLAELLERGEVAGHDLVYGELLIGDKGGRWKLLDAYEHFRQVTIVPHPEVVALVNARRLRGQGAGWIDMHLLASAMVDRIQLWTADAALREIAQELGVAYRSTPVFPG